MNAAAALVVAGRRRRPRRRGGPRGRVDRRRARAPGARGSSRRSRRRRRERASILGGDPRGQAAPARRGASSRPRGAAALPSDGARFLARAPRARPARDRGDQAPLSLGRDDPLPDAAHAASTAVGARPTAAAGAAAISVVIEQDFFGGDPAWLPRAKAVSGLPVLMKDFVVDEVQLDLALSLGADAVLLIVAALDGRGSRAAPPRRPGARPRRPRRGARRGGGPAGARRRARRSSA